MISSMTMMSSSFKHRLVIGTRRPKVIITTRRQARCKDDDDVNNNDVNNTFNVFFQKTMEKRRRVEADRTASLQDLVDESKEIVDESKELADSAKVVIKDMFERELSLFKNIMKTCWHEHV